MNEKPTNPPSSSASSASGAPASELTPRQCTRIARHVTWVGFWVNAALAVLKVLAGIFGRSSAMVADGVHSFSDFISDIIVIVFVGLSNRKADPGHQYGHGKYETFATMLLAAILATVGIAFLVDGIEQTVAAFQGARLERPTWLALGMAIASILSKEWLYRYTRRAGERIDSAVVVANAWHHRSDAMSSLATLVGIGGAMFFGVQWRVLDPIAAMVVSVFILIVAFQIGTPAIKELLEAALPAEIVSECYGIIGNTPGVEAFHRFASRRNGKRMITDFHIKVNPDITVRDAHSIATEVEHRLKARFGRNMSVNIHVEPYAGQSCDENRMCD